MTKLLVCLPFAAAVVAANPVVETYLSEVSVDSAHQFVELHAAPDHQSIDLDGWQILTSASACTLTYQLQYDEYLVVDSAALALGDIGHGSLRVNHLGDSVWLVNDTGHIEDRVRFPSNAPLPPAAGSISFWNYEDAQGQWMNWYIDSTPTPGEANNDYSVITGTLTGTGGVTMEEAQVTADGQAGSSGCGLYQQQAFSMGGLGAGTYQVTAAGYYFGQSYYGVYPESVTVGYAQVVSGIDLVIPRTGVAETPSATLLPPMRVSGRTLLLSSDGTASVNVQLHNQVGSRVSEFHLGPINGEKRIELPAKLAPGIYFATAQKGTHRTTVKVVLW